MKRLRPVPIPPVNLPLGHPVPPATRDIRKITSTGPCVMLSTISKEFYIPGTGTSSIRNKIKPTKMNIRDFFIDTTGIYRCARADPGFFGAV